jgi:hypothetical protein
MLHLFYALRYDFSSCNGEVRVALSGGRVKIYGLQSWLNNDSAWEKAHFIG